MRLLLVPALLALTACAERGDLSDPAYGGFFNGIENLRDGTYDARIASREERLAALQDRQRRLIAERNSLGRRISAHENALARAKQDLVVARIRTGGQLDAATAARVNAALSARPQGETDADRLASLQKTIADTRKLAESLAKLAG